MNDAPKSVMCESCKRDFGSEYNRPVVCMPCAENIRAGRAASDFDVSLLDEPRSTPESAVALLRGALAITHSCHGPTEEDRRAGNNYRGSCPMCVTQDSIRRTIEILDHMDEGLLLARRLYVEAKQLPPVAQRVLYENLSDLYVR